MGMSTLISISNYYSVTIYSSIKYIYMLNRICLQKANNDMIKATENICENMAYVAKSISTVQNLVNIYHKYIVTFHFLRNGFVNLSH